MAGVMARNTHLLNALVVRSSAHGPWWRGSGVFRVWRWSVVREGWQERRTLRGKIGCRSRLAKVILRTGRIEQQALQHAAPELAKKVLVVWVLCCFGR